MMKDDEHYGSLEPAIHYRGTEPSIDEAITVVEAAALIGTMQQIAADLETMMRSLKLA